MAGTILHIVDVLLWVVMALSVAYALFFTLASLLPRKKARHTVRYATAEDFLVIFPAYKEDRVIVESAEAFLRQDYSTDHYHVAVVSDHMEAQTNERLRALPIALLQPSFDKSSKAKALQHAMAHAETLRAQGRQFSRVVVLDADNVVAPDFLSRLNELCRQGHQAIQCHRTAKNNDNGIAVLDGASEEINNTIFRRGHNRLGLSSALIGSGMCFGYTWFRDNVGSLDSAVEDRELESLLMRQDIFICYADDIYVMDEKVSSPDNFQRQRLRWMTGQVQALLRMLPHVPKALAQGNVNYLDKTLQQALIPRSILLLLLPLMAVLTLVVWPAASVKWWLLLAALCLTLLLALPRRLRTHTILRQARLLPQLAWRMLKNIAHIDTRSNEFLHTTHGKEEKDQTL